MKGLLKYLAPFAPDQSGAASVLYDLGGITVIMDAGGCVGNICGFDEPRWFDHKSAIFSAGLRDMDAILGRDDKTIAKLADVAAKVEASFAALVGTPVPAVIATDMQALKRLAKKKCQMPVIAVECTGTFLYDHGEEETYMELLKTFAKEELEGEKEGIGVLGATPLDVSRADCGKSLLDPKEYLYYDQKLSHLEQASLRKKNLVVSPAGLKPARKLQEKFGTPYEAYYPFLSEKLKEVAASDQLEGKKVLILHQQIAANTLREEILKHQKAQIICGTFFMQDKELLKEGDVHFQTEAKLIEYVLEEKFDVIIGDQTFKRPLKNADAVWYDFPHFAVSGELEND